MRSRSLLLVILLAAASLPLIHAIAQDQETAAPLTQNRISLRSKARAVAPADELELTIVVQGSAEEARAAEKKHRDCLRRLLAALTGKEAAKDDESADDEEDKSDKSEKKAKKKTKRKRTEEAADPLPAPGVADEEGLVYDVREGRYTLGMKPDPSQNMDEGIVIADPDQPKKDPELACGSCVHVTLKNLRKVSARKVRKILAQVLDRASDAGVDFGGPATRLRPQLRFRLFDADSVKRQAYADALAKGKKEAESLAQLAGRRLKRLSVITDVPEAPVSGSSQEEWRNADFELFLSQLPAEDAAGPGAQSGSSEVAVEASLVLEFDLD